MCSTSPLTIAELYSADGERKSDVWSFETLKPSVFMCTQEYTVPPEKYGFSLLLLPLLPNVGASPADTAAAAWLQHR